MYERKKRCEKPTNSSDDPAETQGLVTPIHSENLIMMPLPVIKQIYDEHIERLEAKNVEMKKLYDDWDFNDMLDITSNIDGDVYEDDILYENIW